ncbi:hypothetical protein KA012_01960 [Candidatus Woesebacteria bacterium]|nr:hypothetical protein [Candidatus Woesebacteria bacterium]
MSVQPTTEPAIFMIVDGHALIYRAYHAFPPLNDPTGRQVNAVYGFTRILLTAIQELKPTYLTVAFDHKGPTKRASELYDQYKAQRPEMPDDLKPQIAIVKEVVDALNIPRFELEGYEADDLIGTVSKLVSAGNGVLDGVTAPGGVRTIIVTGDKDLLQLVDDKIHVWLPGRGKGHLDQELDAEAVKVKMGVTPLQVIDLKALMGDSSDNIPGVKGVGPKTAIQLIGRFETLDGVYTAVERLQGATAADLKAEGFSVKLLEKLVTDKEMAYLSKELATINRSTPVEFKLAPCRVAEYKKEKTMELFSQLNFRSLQYLLPKDDFELGVQKALF